MNPSSDFDSADNSEMPLPMPPLPVIAEPLSSRCHVDYGAATHKGLVRKNNEDRYWLCRYGRSLHTLLTNLSDRPLPRQLDEFGYGMLVADGMGGAAAGEFAAELAVLTLARLMTETPDWILSSQEKNAERVLERMAQRYLKIDEVLKERGAGEPQLAGMGTTMTLAYSLGPRVVIAHVGDSRAYLLRAGALHRLTRDHSMLQHLLDAGIVQREDQVARHLRHALVQCLGGDEDPCQPEVQQLKLSDGDQILLCTDGLTNMVSDPEIARLLKQSPTAETACQSLVSAALDGGGKDNVTVVLGRYSFARELS
jgi:serine/threonine protein phosphatase PrpC